MIDETRLSRYLDDLPAIYREAAGDGGPGFLGRFLLAFEHVLTGIGDTSRPGLEEILEGIGSGNDVRMAGMHRYFTPGAGEKPLERAPADFLDWLAGWVALTLREDWTEEERRRILAEIVPSYSQRGTLTGLQQALAAFTGVHTSAIKILDQPSQMVSPTGEETVPGGWRPHYFVVRTLVPSIAEQQRMKVVLRSIIDMEKPAHTDYDLFVETTTMRVNVTSTIGQDTVLGVPIESP